MSRQKAMAGQIDYHPDEHLESLSKQGSPGLQVAVYAVLTEEPRRRFSIQDPFAAKSSSLRTSIVMELCDRYSSFPLLFVVCFCTACPGACSNYACMHTLAASPCCPYAEDMQRALIRITYSAQWRS